MYIPTWTPLYLNQATLCFPASAAQAVIGKISNLVFSFYELLSRLLSLVVMDRLAWKIDARVMRLCSEYS